MDTGHGFLERQGKRPRLLTICILALVIALSLALGRWTLTRLKSYDAALKGEQTKAGIVSLELAFTAERAGVILAAWQAQGPEGEPLAYAVKSLKMDLWFILAYAVFAVASFVLLLTILGVHINTFWVGLAALPLVAALADLVENAFLRKLLTAPEVDPGLVLGAGVFAVIKFCLLGLTLLAAFAVFAFWAFHRRTKDTGDKKPDHLVPLSEVMKREKSYIQSRRRKADVPDTDDPAPIGLGLSGGGIRSATLCLGVLQSLAGSGLFRRIDYLSTVSGGGYIGSAISSLLSCKKLTEYLGPDEPSQFEFGADDRPHFDVIAPDDSPFYDDQRTPGSAHRQWLSGRMVVTHLRAFGDYLVRKHRTFDRDVLRAFGTLLTGIFSTLGLFFNVLVIGGALALLALAVTGSEVFPSPGPGYSGELVKGAAGLAGLAWTVGLGGIFAIGAGVICGACADRTPQTWFQRSGDTYEESRQRRALWVLGSLAVPAAFATPAVLNPFLPGLKNGVLLPVCFFGGGFLASILAYVTLVCLIPGKPEERSNRNSRSYLSSIIALLFYFLIAAVGLAAMSALLGKLITEGQKLPGSSALAGGGGAGLIGALVSGLMAWWRNRKQGNTGSSKKLVSWVERSSEIIQKLVLGVAASLVLVVGLMLCMVLVEQILRWCGIGDPGALHYLAFAATAGLLLLIVGSTIDFNKLSMHYFYRDRLAEAYLSTLARALGHDWRSSPEIKREHSQIRLLDLHGRPGKDVKAKAEMTGTTSTTAVSGPAAVPSFVQYRLQSRLLDRVQVWKTLKPKSERFAGAVTAAPYHLYNACLNLSTDRDAAYRSRKSDIFLFSKLYCGAPVTGYVDTGVYRSGETKVARAMTISGAAINSAIGRQTFFAQSFGATLFNIRLGQWMENPCYRGGKHAGRQETGIFWPKYLLMEILGMSDSRRRLVHLSDGGHTGDNLGLIPLLQRRCRLILVVDAECDTDYSFGSLMNAIQYAEADLGIKVDIRLHVLRPDKRGYVAKHYASGTILYPKTDSEPKARGHLVVLKSSVHKEDHETVLKYRQTHPVFPQESTADQFFSEEQFEAYRKLGENIANQLLKEYPELDKGKLSPGTQMNGLGSAATPKETS